MPHFSATKVFASFPFQEENLHFLYEARSCLYPHKSLIHVQSEAHDFCLHKIMRQEDYLFKGEKSTRPVPVGILQKALRVLMGHCEGAVGNLTQEKSCKTSPFLLTGRDFSKFNAFHLEIGFGSGRHLLEKAKNHPQEIYIGLEVHTPSLEQVLRQIELLGLKNLYLARTDARSLLEVLPSSVCLSLDLHFPVPWEKSPTRRVMGAHVFQNMLRVLKKDAYLWLRTDSQIYFQESLRLAQQENCIYTTDTNALVAVPSKYEQRWLKQERNIYDLRVCASASHLPSHKSILLERELIQGTPKPLQEVLSQRHFKETSYFLHIQDVLEYGKLWVLVLSFGDFIAPTNKIALWNGQNLSYVGGMPYNTEANRLAQRKLLEILMEAL
ncbi:tRNA (guanosine(46)-N7)-methyltransferase TrmB [Helicobacter cynogastricus]|uniref:tRNA (guanosine(46)-N7)-methyltransferase TrmB n=1 Tax=Helicobacter cynogastricus TaxID=329937 RepID=UPI000CF06E65|nr:tRNA (guanosine(46)-N7)-methyltransferase TrmB [Helicobacter cynogastricus]